MHMTPQQELEFQAATHCHICEQSFKSGQKKVRDHNHLIPENNFRGAACEGCNVNYQDTHTIPVVFHNLSGYDAHFVVTDIATRMDGKIDLLPITKEKYISFTKHINESRICFRFIDSFRFMASSLDKLSSALTNFPNLKSQFSTLPEDQFNILTKKGIMPYDYFDSFDRFDELCLPPQDAFYNKLEDKPCPRRMYRRAQEVWSRFNCSNLGQYVDLYMKTDILLLADVFEQFRSSCISTYDLDPAHYFTLPGFTWDAMLKYTRQELELLTDQDMFLFVERGIRGGLSQVCSKRRAHANNKYMSKYDSTKPDVYLMYNDINNQYGWSMSQYLPYGGFEWVDSNIDITTIPDDADEGYILEVDLEYPQHLHDAHTDLPFYMEDVEAFVDVVLESVPVIDGHRQRVAIVQEEVIQLPPTVVEFNFVPAGEGSSKLIYRYQPRSLQTLSGAAVLNKFKYRSFVPENIYGYIYMPKRILYFLKKLWRARQLKIIWRTEIHEALTNKEICNITSIRTLKSRYPTTLIAGINNTSIVRHTYTRQYYEGSAAPDESTEMSHPWITPYVPASSSYSSLNGDEEEEEKEEQEVEFRSIEMDKRENEQDYKIRIDRLISRIQMDQWSLHFYPELELEHLPYHNYYRNINVDPRKIDLTEYTTYQVKVDANLDLVTKKINSLRSSYRKEKKKVADSLKSGAGTEEVYSPTLWYYDLFKFLDDQETPRAPVSNFEDAQESQLAFVKATVETLKICGERMDLA
ncbi:hypothetical protein PPYR_01467 [Photinus pyralis]|uniref:MADF domain-containing protein n=1 Tax=Photinus pyralis TaxID=7054 RepID=A0A5N4B4F2_PHOPY|nr:hypothetical protein PPYR_01467 [Photinus pyralis]